MPYYFLILLKLTELGRGQADAAAENLQAQRARIEELEGVVTSVFMTFGRHDAVIAGEVPDIERLTFIAAKIGEDGFFTAETSVGVGAPSFTSKAVPLGHHG